jgi:preprotein translocase subunit SecG
METILRVFQVFLAVGLIGAVLLQRSEGGGLGMGSSGGSGSFMSVRGSANFMTRVTAILAGLFMVTCLALALLAKPSAAPRSIFDVPAPAPAAPVSPAAEAPAPTPAAPETAPPATSAPAAVTPPSATSPAATAPAAAPPADSKTEPAAKKPPQSGATQPRKQ